MSIDRAWQLDGSGEVAESGFVPVTSERRPGDLPEPLTSFVGRQDDLAALDGLSRNARLVTVVGPAGAGKTRLALEHARILLANGPPAGGIWLCDLTEARSVRGICAAVAGCLGVPLVAAERDDVERVAAVLAGRGPTVIVLDNFEQLLAHAPETVGRWLDVAGDLRLVVTSRAHLGLPAERILELGPLPLPGEVADPWTAASVRLFIERAAAARHGYEPSGDLAAIVDIVRQLDGLPLAIELAASRMGVLGAGQIAAHLNRRFELLRSPGSGLSPRQATMRGAIAWSWDLLEPHEQQALAQCSVFRGGFELDAARSVIHLGDRRGALWVLDVVQALVEKSLVQAYEPVHGRGELRYRLYESVREFGAERLTEMAGAGGELATTERHDAHYTELARRLLEQRDGSRSRRALQRVALELDNLLLVHARNATRAGEISAERAMTVACALEPLMSARGCLGALETLLDTTLRHHSGVATPRLEAGCLIAHARALAELGAVGDSEMRRRRALELARASADRRLEGRALGSLAHHAWRRGELAEAARLGAEALAIHREVGDLGQEGRTASQLGQCHHWLGDLDRAREQLGHALAVVRQHGDSRSEAIALSDLGNLEIDQGDAASARDRFELALDISRSIGDRYDEGYFLAGLGMAALELGDLALAREHYEEAADTHQRVGNPRGEGIARAYLGLCAEMDGRSGEARRAYRDAQELLSGHGPPLPLGLVHCWRGRLEADAGQLTAARRHLALGSRLLAELGDNLVSAVPALCGAHQALALAAEAHADGDFDEAGRLGEQARELVARLRAGDERHRSSHVRLALARLRASLGSDAPRLSWAPPSQAELFDGVASEGALTISSSGRSFCAPGGEPVDLSTRRAPRLILRALAEQRERHPGVALDLDALLAAGWPGERLLTEAGATRVYTAIATLRRMGLKPYLLRCDDGYMIDVATPLVRWGSS